MAAPKTQTGHTNSAVRLHPGPLLIALAYVGFVSLGLPDAVTGVAWPTIRDTFRLPQAAVGLVSWPPVWDISRPAFFPEG
jgi:hypothetical protein